MQNADRKFQIRDIKSEIQISQYIAVTTIFYKLMVSMRIFGANRPALR